MKTKFQLALFSFIFSVQFIFAQKTIDAYKAEADRYFVHPVNTISGVIATDNFASAIYLIQDKKLKELISSPSCGRYFSLSPDKSKIGFKGINADGTQIPAVYDLVTGGISPLSTAVKLCGQPSFSNNGKMAFTIGNELNVVDGINIQTIDLGVYSNIAPISPDGNNVIYNDDRDQLFMKNLATGKAEQITNGKCGYAFPQWSPDGNKVAYSTLAGNIMIWDKTEGKTYSIGSGENVSWSDDSRNIIFNRNDVENFQFKGSDIYISSFDGSKIVNLTNTPDVNEIAPSFGPNNTIIYSTFEKKEIISSEFDLQNLQMKNKTTLVKYTSQLLPHNNNSNKVSSVNNINSIVTIPGTVPYVNQVYDTPTWHSGYSSCAATSSIMALAYYNKLPKWPTTVYHGMSWDPHTSDYGSYVADEYRYNGTYFNLTATDYASNTSWGGYGYMWNGSSSPATMMAPYLQNHNMTSVYSGSTVFTDVQTEINNGYPFPICNTLSSAGHLTLAIGYVNGQHTLIFNDSYGNKNTGTWPNNTGQSAYYDWPGYNNGYQNLNTVAWTVTAESTQLAYNDTIVDDVNYNNGFFINNQPVSHMKYFHDSETGGYGTYSHYWWTYTSSSTNVDTCYVKWTPTLTTTGNYNVSAYIPASNATATAARYKVYYNNGNQTVVINQSQNAGQWVSLGTFPFLQGNTGYVRLGDAGGNQGQQIAFDAVKWNYIPASTGIAQLYSDTHISISPNPAKDIVTISDNEMYKEMQVSIFDVQGKKIADYKFQKQNPINLDVSNFSKGIYFVKIKTEKSVETKKLAIQ
jgi:hypothetical protein